jgi:pimeloyl-ACP methyl ester carboxylesterase
VTIRKLLWSIVLLALVLSACNAAPAPQAAVPTPAATGGKGFEKTNCWFKEPAGRDVECGWLTVPEDHAKPDGKTIKLAVARFKSDASKPEPDPIVYLHGGPGGSILKSSILSQFDISFGPLLAKRDLILFDQRGIGYSQPALDCPEMVKLAFDTLDQNLNAAQSEELNNKALLDCHDRLVKQGVNLDFYNSVQNAADLDALRQALGYEKINLYGISYGTRLALTALRDNPAGIRSVIIDSVYTPQEDLYAGTPANGARAIEALFTACAAESSCNGSFPNLRQTFFDLKAKLDKEPAKFNITLKSGEKKEMLFNGDSLVGLVFQAMYDSSALPLLPRLISDINDGNYDLAAVFEGALLDEIDTISNGMHYAVQCNEEVPFDQQSAIDSALKQYPEYAALASQHIIDTCKAYGSKPADPIENQPVSSDVPTLVFSGEFDPITPPAWAEDAAKTLSKSFYFNVPRAGHGSSLSVDCPRSILLSFLDDPSQKPNNDCLAEQAKGKFAVPPKVSDYRMAPFTELQMNFDGVAPDGWKKLGPGTYTPTGKATDPVGLVQQAAPLPPDTLLNLLENQLKGSDATIKFEQTGTRSANGIDWNLYSAVMSASGIDLALGEKDKVTYLVMMQSLSIDRKVLYEAIFLPAVEALKPSK